MKKMKTVIIWLVLAFIVLQHIGRISYYKRLLGNEIDMLGNLRSVINILDVTFLILIDLFTVILAIITLSQTDKREQDRTYSMFRFVYIMRSLMIFPLIVYQYISFAPSLFAEPLTASIYIFRNLVWITLVIFLIKCKPDRQIQKVDLKEYDMVSFTSIGHRFAHYLVDILFMLPIGIWVIQFLFLREQEPLILKLIFNSTYLLYCFLSEIIFGQTLGKMITRSCVVSNGVHLSTGRVLLRTICRVIPFDGISFLFGAKWHDRVSSTAVVYVDSWEIAFDEKKQGADA
jgi:hypothetical protein